jgi:hypothetical protein
MKLLITHFFFHSSLTYPSVTVCSQHPASKLLNLNLYWLESLAGWVNYFGHSVRKKLLRLYCWWLIMDLIFVCHFALRYLFSGTEKSKLLVSLTVDMCMHVCVYIHILPFAGRVRHPNRGVTRNSLCVFRKLCSFKSCAGISDTQPCTH